MKRLLVTATVAALVPLFAVTGASASDPPVTICDQGYSFQTFGNVVVQPGSDCRVQQDVITGNVINHGGTLELFGSTIAGNVISVQAPSIELVGGTINGNVQITGTTGTPSNPPEPHNFVCDAWIGGNLVLVHNQAAYAVGGPGFGCAPGPNTVVGNLEVNDNLAAIGISGNAIGGILACHNNTPSVFGDPGSNTAFMKQGECAGL